MPESPKEGAKSRERVPCRIVPYGPEHASLVAGLQRHLWTPDAELNAAYLDWKYHQNPYIREPLIYLAFADEQLVGMRGVFGTRWEVGEPSESFTLPYADDLLIDPAFRRGGVHGQLMRFALDDLERRGYRYLISLSAGPVTQRTSVLMRWRNAGSVNHVQRRAMRRTTMDAMSGRFSKLPVVWRLAETLQRLGGPAGDRVFDRFDSRSVRRGRRRNASAIFSETAPLADEMASLVNRLPTDGRFRHVRDRTYFEWRFRNPLRSYRFLYAGGDRLAGYLVLQRALDRNDRACIVDWEAEHVSVLDGLLTAAIEEGRFPVLSAWRLGASPAAGQLLDRRGFKPAVRSKCVLVRAVRSTDLDDRWMLAGRPLDDASQWDLRMAYSMDG
jgi:GNAT superfamily N-acetyltransferase